MRRSDRPFSLKKPDAAPASSAPRQRIKFTSKVHVSGPDNGSPLENRHFVMARGPAAAEIEQASRGLAGASGAVRVLATIGTTTWWTSVSPDRKSGNWMLPLKADVRKREGIEIDVEVVVLLEV
jgi:hypothetical protein